MLSHLLANFKIQKYYQNERKFNGVYSRNNLPQIKDVTYVVNLHELMSIGTHWIALHVNGVILLALESKLFQKILKN